MRQDVPINNKQTIAGLKHSAESFKRKNILKNTIFSVALAGLLAVVASPVFAQSGDISGATSSFTMLGGTILKLLIVLAGFAFVGLIIWGSLTLATNRPRGLAMIGGGMVGALLAGLAFVVVNTLTGRQVNLSMLHIPVQLYFS